MTERIDSKGWTGDIESQTAPGNSRWSMRPSPRAPWSWAGFDDKTPDQSRAQVHAFLVMAAPAVLLFLDWAMLAGLHGDYRTAEPPIRLYFTIAILIGAALFTWASLSRRSARLCRRLGKFTWLGAVAASFAYFFLGLHAHATASAGPEQRAQIVDYLYERRTAGRGLIPTVRKAARFLLRDGSQLDTIDYPDGRNCFVVRRLQGRFGFAWLRIVESVPGSGPGGTNWQIDRAACFSAIPLALLRR